MLQNYKDDQIMSGLEIIINKPALCVYSHKLQDISDNLVWIFSNFFWGGGEVDCNQLSWYKDLSCVDDSFIKYKLQTD